MCENLNIGTANNRQLISKGAIAVVITVAGGKLPASSMKIGGANGINVNRNTDFESRGGSFSRNTSQNTVEKIIVAKMTNRLIAPHSNNSLKVTSTNSTGT